MSLMGYVWNDSPCCRSIDAYRAVMLRIIPAALAATALTGGLIPVIPAAQAATDDTCADTTVVAFRGSGEERVADSTAGTDGWEGPTLNRVAQAARDAGASVTFRGVGWDAATQTGYEAIPLDLATVDLTDVGSIMPKLIASASAGAVAASGTVDSVLARCPDTNIVAVGYSQGAMAARTLAQLRPDAVSGAVVLGDPYRVGENAGQGIVRWWSTDDSGLDDGVVKASFSHPGDPVSDHDWRRGITSVVTDAAAHTDYAEGGEAGDIVDAITGVERPDADASTGCRPVVVMFERSSLGQTSVNPYCGGDPGVVGITTEGGGVVIRTGGLGTHTVSVDGGEESRADGPVYALSAGVTSGDHVVTVDGHRLDVTVVDYDDQHRWANLGDTAREVSAVYRDGVLTADIGSADQLAGVRITTGTTSTILSVQGLWDAGQMRDGVTVDKAGIPEGAHTLVLVTETGQHAELPFNVSAVESQADSTPDVSEPSDSGSSTAGTGGMTTAERVGDGSAGVPVTTPADQAAQSGTLPRTGIGWAGVLAGGVAAMAGGLLAVLARRRHV